jgi:hypothetical protein
MHSFGAKWITVIALAVSLAGCTPTAPAEIEPSASPSETVVTMKEWGQCAEVQSRIDVLFAAYDEWLGRLEIAALIGGSENDLRGYLQNRAQLDIPRELWTTVETGLESGTASLREAIDQQIFLGVPTLVPQQEAAYSLIFQKKIDALIAASRQPPSDTPFMQGLRVLDTFPQYGNSLKDFMTSYCTAT